MGAEKRLAQRVHVRRQNAPGLRLNQLDIVRRFCIKGLSNQTDCWAGTTQAQSRFRTEGD